MNEKDEWIVQKYKEEEKMMILLFAQWCIDNEQNPEDVYRQAYPDQETNPLLKEVLQETVPAKESAGVETELLLDALSAFGNDDLAFVVADISYQENRKRLGQKE